MDSERIRLLKTKREYSDLTVAEAQELAAQKLIDEKSWLAGSTVILTGDAGQLASHGIAPGDTDEERERLYDLKFRPYAQPLSTTEEVVPGPAGFTVNRDGTTRVGTGRIGRLPTAPEIEQRRRAVQDGAQNQ